MIWCSSQIAGSPISEQAGAAKPLHQPCHTHSDCLTKQIITSSHHHHHYQSVFAFGKCLDWNVVVHLSSNIGIIWPKCVGVKTPKNIVSRPFQNPAQHNKIFLAEVFFNLWLLSSSVWPATIIIHQLHPHHHHHCLHRSQRNFLTISSSKWRKLEFKFILLTTYKLFTIYQQYKTLPTELCSYKDSQHCAIS